jgi:hypothetical protein
MNRCKVIYAGLSRKFVQAPWLPFLEYEVLPDREAGGGIERKDEEIGRYLGCED